MKSRTAPGSMHLAIRAPNWVGDLAMATPVLEAAARDARVARLSLVVPRGIAPLVADAPYAASVVPLERGTSEVRLYRSLAPDALLLLSNSFGAALRAFRARVPVRAGSALSGRRWLLTHALVPPSLGGRRIPIPTAHLLRDLAQLLGIFPESVHPRLYVREELRERVREELVSVGLARGAPYVLCCPGAAFGAAKLWPPEHFAAALDRLHELRGLRAVVSGGPGEEQLMEAVAAASRSGAISLARAPRDLERLKALALDASLVLVGDSGPRWIAAAFDRPCVSVLGPTSAALTASSLEHCRVVRLELECSPCLARRCPLKHHRCMRELGPELVVAAALELLQRESAGAAFSQRAGGSEPGMHSDRSTIAVP